MLSPEIKGQVIAVLQARMIEDKAYREVMSIHSDTPIEEAERRQTNFDKCSRMVMRQERTLANLVIKEHNQESETVPDDSITH